MSDYEISLLIERAQRAQVRQKIVEWERTNGIQLMPMVRDFTKGRTEQLVGSVLEDPLRKREQQ